jgi:Immunoglobulin domain/Putative Ig domain
VSNTPIIVTQPVGSTAFSSGSLLLSVAARASNATTASPSEIANANLFFQWQKDGVDIPGATQRTFNLTLTSAVRGFYSVRVTLGGEVVKSNEVLVSHATWPAIITKQPTSVNYHRGDNAKLSIAVFGTLSTPVLWFDASKSLSWAWPTGSDLASIQSGNVQAALVGTGLELQLANGATAFGRFYAVLGISVSQISASQANINNLPASVYDLVKTAYPVSDIVTASRQWLENVETGELLPLSPRYFFPKDLPTFRVDAGTELAVRIYEPESENYGWWHAGQNPISGFVEGFVTAIDGKSTQLSNSSTLFFGIVSASDFGNYAVTAPFGTAYFGVAATLRPTITQQPVSSNAPVYSKIAFSVIAGPAGEAVTYQWKKGDSLIEGATSAEYRFTLTEATAGSYSVEVSLGGYTVASNKAEARILQPPVIITQPQGASVLLGASISLGVAVAEYNFTQPVTALWKRDGVSLSANGTNFNFYVNGVTEADLGAYTVDLTNAAGTTVSARAIIKFAAPQIAVQPTAVQVSGVGAAASLSCAATLNSGSVTYQWQRNEVNVVGATQATLNFTSVQAADFGRYRCLVTSSGGTANSDTVLLSAGAALAPSLILPSALGLKRGEFCNIPLFSNSEIKTWSTTALPDGLVLEPANGRIIGTPTTAGIYVVSISAANAFGNNTQVLLLDVAETSGTRKAGFNAWIDVETRAVSVNGKPEGVVTCKPGDDVLLFVRFVKGGVPVDLDVQSLQVMFEDAPELILDFVKKVDAVGDFYVLRVSIPVFQGDFPMREQAQFAWTATNAWSVGPSIILGSSNSFPVVIEEHWGTMP